MAAAVPPIGGAIAAPHRDYSSLYNDDSLDQAGGNYAGIMATFRVPVQGAPPPQSIATAVYQSATVDPQAFMLLVGGPNHPGGQIMLFHRLQRYEPQLGRATPFDNQGYAFFGDVVRGQAPPTVHWEAGNFHQANGGGIRVPTREAVDQAFADPAVELFNPPDPADAGTEVVRVRNTVLLPFRYVRLLLAGPLSPREAWIQIGGAIANDGNEEDCTPVMDWLRVALVKDAGSPISRIGRAFPNVPLALPVFIERRWDLVVRDLPSWGTGASQAAGNAIAAGLNDLVADNRASRQAELVRRQADSAKTPSKYFGAVGVSKLLRICQVADEAALPSLWKDLASSPKKQDVLVIQQAFNAMAHQELNMPGSDVPITPDIVTKIRNLSFEMTNNEDLSTSIHCFTFGFQTAVERAAAYELIERYQLMQQGVGAPSLAEAATFNRSAISGKLPQTLTQATICLANTRIALHVLLSHAHPVVMAFDHFWQAWGSSQQHLVNVQTRRVGGLPALAVRWVQLRLSLWFAQQAAMMANVVAPDFGLLLQEIQLQTPWEPTLPGQYYESPTPLAKVPVPAPPVAPPPAANTPSGVGQRQVPERNLSMNPAFAPFAPFAALNLRIVDVLSRAGAGNRPPRPAGGSEVCLSYHVKGMCNSDCRRRADHRVHTTEEDATLLEWCRQWYVPPPPS